MLGLERLDKILDMLRDNQVVTVRTIVNTLYISEATARRDLIELENRGLARRVHGGVILTNSDRGVPFSLRESEVPDRKSIVGERAAALVKQGQVIMLDASTSCGAMVRYLPDNGDLLVITSGIKTAAALAERRIRTLVTGGTIMDNTYSMVGYYAQHVVGDMVVDTAFLSCRGISEDGRICGVMPEEIQLRSLMSQHARRIVILLTANKIGKEYYYTFGSIEDVDEIICDGELPPAWQPRIGKNRR